MAHKATGSGTCQSGRYCCGQDLTCWLYGGMCTGGFPWVITPVTPFINPYWVNTTTAGSYECYPGTPSNFGLCDYTRGEICCDPSPPNPYPATPSASCTVIGLANNNYSFSFSGTDNENVRYGVNWNGGETVEEWLPSSGFVASGTSLTAQHSWTSIGTKTVKVMTQSQSGQYSALWGTCSVNIVANLSVEAGGPYTHTLGTPTALSATKAGGGTITSWNWSITDNAGNCTLTNPNTASPTISCSNIYTNTTVSVTATDSLGETASDTATVRTIPVPSCSVSTINPNPLRRDGNSVIVVSFGDFQSDPALSVADSVDCGNGSTASLVCTSTASSPFSGTCLAQCAYSVSSLQNLSVGAIVASASQSRNCSVRTINLTPNLAPSVPTIVRTSGGSANVGSLQSFNFTSTDPESDAIRYHIDWNNDGVYDEIVPQSTSAGVALPSGLVAHWRGDWNARDSVGAYHGTLTNGSYSPGAVSAAFDLSNGTSYITIPNNAVFDFAANPFSIDAWIFSSSKNFQVIFSNQNITSPYRGYALAFNINEPAMASSCAVGNICFYDGVSWRGVASGINLYSWTRVAFVRNGTT